VPTLLLLAYDGTDLSGCPEVRGRRTVVGELRAALGRAGVHGALECLSRTDAGVHARGQVAVAEPDRRLGPDRLLLALDRHLPPDLRCVGAAEVDGVPAVRAKTYRYTFDLSPFGDPRLARCAWRARLDADRLVALTPRLVGRRDLSAFRRRGETRADLVRTIEAASCSVDGAVATIAVRGDGFAYRGVRSLVGALVAVARGAASEDDLDAALAGVPTDVARQQAPARGLSLDEVELEPAPAWVRTLRGSA
jgi:tRNA pseudouridine38-40 synthase